MYPTVSSCSFPPFYSCGFPIWHWPITGVTMGKMGLTPHPHPLVSTCNPSITVHSQVLTMHRCAFLSRVPS